MTRSSGPPVGVLPLVPDDPAHLGPFRVLGRLGSGGMGVVYAALDGRDRRAAVKCVHRSHAADQGFRDRFAREVRLVRRVRATALPTFLDADTRADSPWPATEYVPGPTLDEYVRGHGPLRGDSLIAFALGVVEALTAIHSAGVVHRDLKPGNVILAPDGPKVLDFGIARAADGTVLTATGGLHGTPGWVAPERYEGVEAAGHSDMFAWGGLVAVAATGRPPFGRGAVDGVVHRSRHEDPDLDGVPEHLMDLVRRSLDKDPGERPRPDAALAELTRGWSATRVMPGGALPPTRVEEPGPDADPTEIVPELLAAEWRGVADPGTRRVRGSRRTVWLSAAAVAAEAIELMEGASDYLYRHDFQADQERAHPSATVTEYTEEPVRAIQRRNYEPAGVRIDLRHGAELEEQVFGLVTFDGSGDSDPRYYRQEGTFFEDLDLVASADWGLTQILEPDAEIEYQGRNRVPHEQELLDGGVSAGLEFQETEGHHYSGTFTEPVNEEGVGGGPMSFDLWVDDEGYPLRFAGSGARVHDDPEQPEITITETRDYVFHEPRDVHVPEESEILSERPTPGS